MKLSSTNLTLRLTEPVVFLRGNPTGDPANKPRRQRHAINTDPSPSLIRGILILQLSKPAKVKKIGIKLKGITRTEWPEGIGPRQNDFYDEKVILEERMTFFDWQTETKHGPVLGSPAQNGASSLHRSASAASHSRQSAFTDDICRLALESSHEQSRDDARRSSNSPHNTSNGSLPERTSRKAPSVDAARGVATHGEHRAAGFGSAFASVRGAFSRSRSRAPETTPRRETNGPIRHASPARAPRSVSRGRGMLVNEVDPDASFVETKQGNYRTSPSPGPHGARSVSRGARAMSNGASRSQSRGRDTAGRPILGAAADAIQEAVGRGRSQEPMDSEKHIDKGGRSPSRGRSGRIEEADGKEWRIFQAGTYTYPIALSIPASSPPSVLADFGSTAYTLTAKVIRAGALTTNLTASTEVLVVCTPGDDDTEEVDSIIIERAWEDQMRYEIGLSGKAWPIGTSMPVTFKITPLEKIQVHRITAVLEEKKDFLAHEGKIKRQAAKEVFQLLQVGGVPDQPILPNEENGPGPWELHYDLRLPTCKSRINFSTIHPESAIRIQHTLKMTIRVTRGDDLHLDSKGRRKQFDIIIEALGTILSCRCTSVWTSLPAYEHEDHLAHMEQHHRLPSATQRPAASSSLDETVPESENPLHEYSVTDRDIVLGERYAELAAGQMDATGMAPPAYHEVAARAESPEPMRGRSTGVATPSNISGSVRSSRAPSPT